MSKRPITPVASGARIAGDDYQHLYTWLHALHLLRQSEGVTRVEFEVRDAGNVDDLVVHQRDQPTLYHQIKFVMSQKEQLSCDWFTTVPVGSKLSPLIRFRDSFRQLSTDAHPAEMALWTNRQLVPGDPILQHLDSRTARLGPHIHDTGLRSATGKALKVWADHLGVDQNELLQMLEHLHIHPGRGSLEELRRDCGIYMEAVGLRSDVAAVSLGTNEIRQLIISGCSALEEDDMRELVTRLGLEPVAPRGTLLIQAIAPSAWPEVAAASIDWLSEFDGQEPRERRQLRDPERWNSVLKPQLDEAADEVRRKGFTDIRIDGAFRLSTGFAAGAALPRAAGVTVAFRDWSSAAESTEFPVKVTEHNVAQGDELAIAIAVTGPLTDEVFDYVHSISLPIEKLLVIEPASGTGQTGIPGEAEAIGFAYAAFAEIRAAARQRTKLHVFANCPNGIAILLGHLWNRVPTTQLYDDANGPLGYFPTFLLPS